MKWLDVVFIFLVIIVIVYFFINHTFLWQVASIALIIKAIKLYRNI